MIEFERGDILKDNSEAIVNTVNCVGVMGRGIALQFKNVWPENFESYALACKRGEVQPGKMFVYETGHMSSPRYIINFPTKRHWRGKSRMEDIQSGLLALVEEIRNRGIQSVAIPPLGSGMGGLEWAAVRSKIIQHMNDLPSVRVRVFEPLEARDVLPNNPSRDVPKMTPGRAVLIELMDNYLRGLLDPSITLLEVQKLMYFMQEAGQALRLNYEKGAYGPYAPNLGKVLQKIEGHFISGYADGGDNPDKPLVLVVGAIDDAKAYLANDSELRARFDRVSDLVDGFENSFGLELLATVHWVVRNNASASHVVDIVRHVHDWSPRKRQQFTPRQIGIAHRVLAEKGWLSRDTG
jgi:O-acetyl-ADP-ribose deacetylase (regulator of RNase III)